MGVTFENNLPIYLQLATMFYEKLACGEWVSGQRLPAVREMAVTYSVNPNTLQRAFGQLERDGYLYTESTNGRFVTQDADKLTALREEMAAEKITACKSALTKLGYTEKEAQEMFKAQK